jgi:hypothetical protein
VNVRADSDSHMNAVRTELDDPVVRRGDHWFRPDHWQKIRLPCLRPGRPFPSKAPTPPSECSWSHSKALGNDGDRTAALDLARRALPKSSVVADSGHPASFAPLTRTREASIPERLRWNQS